MNGLPREENRNDDLLSEQLNWDLSEYFPIKKWLKIHGTHALITGQDKGMTEVRWLAGIIDSMDMSLSKLWEMVTDRAIWHNTVRGGHRIGHD